MFVLSPPGSSAHLSVCVYRRLKPTQFGIGMVSREIGFAGTRTNPASSFSLHIRGGFRGAILGSILTIFLGIV